MNRIAAFFSSCWKSWRLCPATGACSVSAVLALAAAANAAVINEVRLNAPGSETPSEFIELLGAPGESLDGLYFVGIGDDGANVGVVENLVDLSSQAIPSDGFFVIANSDFGDGSALGFDASVVDFFGLDQQLENNDVVSYLLVTGDLSGVVAGVTDLDTNDDGTLDSTPWVSIVDGVGLLDVDGEPDADPDYTGQLGIPALGPDGSFVPAHIYRAPNGGDWEIGPFSSSDAVDTPGATNIPEPTAIGLLVAGLAGSRIRRRLS